MINHTCIHRHTCYSYSHTNCDGCNNADTDYNEPKKKMILVGLSNRSLGWEFFKAVLDSLDRYSIKYDHVDCIRLRFETNHTKTWFVFANDPYDMLEGIRADAIFGSGYERLLYRAKPNAFIAHRKGVGLVDYISEIEYEHNVEELKVGLLKNYPTITYDVDVPNMYPSTLYLTMPRCNGKSLYRHALNAIYGKFGTSGTLPTDYIHSIQNKNYNELTKGENNMNAVYNDLVRGKAAYLVTDNGKVPVNIENITSSYEYGSTKIEFEGRMLTPTLSDIIDRRVTSVMNTPTTKLPGIKTVHFSGPVTVVIWDDKTKTVVRCKDGDEPDYEKGLAMAIAKKAFGTNKSGSNYYDIFKKWLATLEDNHVGFGPEPKEDLDENLNNVTETVQEAVETPAPKKRKSKKVVGETENG